ncbi:MAG: relaxase domain-containing protein [Verrucomicrobiota bacterium]|nr:relaxase domain-containing protein [Verrucomicrobiota bacterium]
MLSPKTQTNLKNAKGYFEEHLSVGDYYSENERVRGEWIGKGAEMLGLAGGVTRDEFLALCDNLHPQSREQLTQRRNTVRRAQPGEGEAANRRVFYDFTFSPPKSVSVAALVAGDKRIIAAHADAVKIALKELEEFAATRVRGGESDADRRTSNIVAALFEHETSRALDPHLHTHCIIFNATHDSQEQRWKALQNYEMLGAQKYVENVYYHELARALQSFGYTIVNSARGDFELQEIPREICERFSKRHREIDEKTREFLISHPDKRVGNEAAIREHIAHKDRARKSTTPCRAFLRRLWEEQLSPEELGALRNPRVAESAPHYGAKAEQAVLWAEAHLFERRSVVREYELWRHALQVARAGPVSVSEIKQLTRSRDYLRGDNDKIAHREMLAREWEIVCAATDGVGRHAPFASVGLDGQLALDQQLALSAILSSQSFITLFRGGAGTGKSFVLQRVQGAIDKSGQRSVVLAPQRQQVIDLARDGLVQTQTVSECLQRGTLPDRAVVIVDEAGQIGGRQLLGLIRLVQEVGGRLILSGDTRQHGPIEASDALRAIERYAAVPAAQLEQVRRQDPKRARSIEERKRIEQYRGAVEAAAAGDLARSVRKLEGINAFVECGAAERNDEIRDAYLEIAERGESALVISQTRAEVRAINNAIRARLRQRGVLGEAESQVTGLEQIDLTAAQKIDARHYPPDCVLVFNRDLASFKRGVQAKLIGITAKHLAFELAGKVRQMPLTKLDHLNVCRATEFAVAAGDKLQLKANSSTRDGRKLANGEIVSVAAIKPDRSIRLQDGRVLPPQYRQFVRGYAVTSYGSQGKTVDHVLFADSAVRAASNAQQWYVTISRGRKSIRIFTPDKQELQRAITRSGERELALDLMAARSQNTQGGLRSIRRGRQFARRVCGIAMRSWTAAVIKLDLTRTHERQRQTNRQQRTNLLAA